jgi:antitoxin MazE
MKTRLVSIGNSRGVRLPKPFIEQAGITDEVDVRVEGTAIIVAAVRSPRAGWAEAAARMAATEPGATLDGYVPTRFDEDEWEW